MGLQIFTELPKANGDLVSIENLPIIVTPNESFHQAKATLLALVEQAGSLANSIHTDPEYDQGIQTLQAIKRFKKDIEAGAKPGKDAMNRAKDQLMGYLHELDVPASKLETALSTETARYFQDRERRRREKEDADRREAELERQRKQREADLNALRMEIQTARQEATSAEMREQPDTAREIRAGLKRFAALDAAPGGYQRPLEDATAVRQAVALALQHEQARIAAARARAEGDKAAARAIEKADAKLEAPIVAPVISERIEAAPVVVPKDELSKAKGQWLNERWVVDEVFDPRLVPDEFKEVSVRLLNDYASRMKANACVPGVRFKREAKMAGIRS